MSESSLRKQVENYLTKVGIQELSGGLGLPIEIGSDSAICFELGCSRRRNRFLVDRSFVEVDVQAKDLEALGHSLGNCSSPLQ